jgi:hypothetical protein
VKSYAESNGDTSSLYYGARTVSEKVTGLQFQYWDGTAWVADWDSDANSGLPKAIEIQLTIQTTYGMTEEEIERLDTTAQPAPKPYRLVVKIPAAALAPPAAEEATTDAASADAAAGGGATTGGTMP